jgi:hypothetical protein
MALFVLGAGATRGCSFIDAEKKPCIPPLDSDFFTQLQRVENPKHQPLIAEVMKDVVTLFGTNFGVTLETVFATLEHTIRMLGTTGDTRDFKRADLAGMRDRLLQAIAVVLEESLCNRKTSDRPSPERSDCKHHAKLVEEALKSQDDIISFNYDCTIDLALKSSGSGKWNPRYGYGFWLGPGGHNLSGDHFWSPDSPASKSDTIHLYKLHGSLHFQIREKERLNVTLKQRPYTKQYGDLKFTIIPPESNKAYDKGIFRVLWNRAAWAIKHAQNIIIIGYSFQATDLHSTALFRTSVSKGRLNSLVVVNPDREVRRRTRSVLQRGINENTRVLSFDSMKEFLATDHAVWRT